ncbi:MAG: type 1 glutamine amidotransferase [Proteobacteria bacterium]|nr:type 1 glutamine amidotransferase [Pseudomonadota bacterium]MBU1697201.1 type 1 glutamine amidotransferase [Pseudomonadota bacterium]
MEQILVIQNSLLAPAGSIGDVLKNRGVSLTTIRVLAGEQKDIDTTIEYDGLLVLGGPSNAYNDEAYPQNLVIVDIIRRFHKLQKPILGLCLGAQFLARALGQSYCSNNGWEIGFTPITVTAEGEKDPILAGLDSTYMLYEMHEDSFFLPPDSELLMTGKHCVNQAFRSGKYSYGFQFHAETNASIIRGWAKGIRRSYPEKGPQMVDLMFKDMDEFFPAQKKFAYEIGRRWLNLVKEVKEGNKKATDSIAI